MFSLPTTYLLIARLQSPFLRFSFLYLVSARRGFALDRVASTRLEEGELKHYLFLGFSLYLQLLAQGTFAPYEGRCASPL